MRRFNKQNCTSSVRAQITDKWGRTITLMGTHAFDWTIYVEESTGNSAICRGLINNLKPRDVKVSYIYNYG